MEDKDLIRVSEWAASQQFSRQNAYKAIRNHGIPFYDGSGNRNPDGHFINRAEANRIWEQSKNPAKQRGGRAGGEARQDQMSLQVEEDDAPITEPITSKLGQAQLAYTLIRIKERRLSVDQIESKLVQLASVRRFESEVFAHAKTQLMAIASELRDDLAAETDPRKCEDMLDRRIRRALTNISQWRPDAA
jgi:hypothetical protein